MKTLEEARAYIMDHADNEEGVDCPVCSRRVKRYNRHLSSPMIIFLWRLYQYSEQKTGEFFWSRDFMPSGEKASTDAAYLTKWGFMVRGKPGQYALTERGKLFIEGKVDAPAYIKMLCGQQYDVSNRRVVFESFRDEVDRGEP